MTYEELARQLPTKYRRHLLDNNVIYKALPSGNDPHMEMLWIYWKGYFDTGAADFRNACNLCLNNVLSKFKLMEGFFIKIEKESKLLEL